MDTDSRLGPTLRQLRRAAGLTQEELAERAQLSVRGLRNLEAGRTVPRQQTLTLLGDALGLTGQQQAQLRAGLLNAAGTLHSLVTPRHVPPPTLPFIGRHAEFHALNALLDGPTNLVLITGMPGVGKTALALQFAHTLAEHFAEGQLYADLRGFTDGQRPVRAGEVAGQFLRALGVDHAAVPAAVEERAALLRSVLAGRRILLVLDNVAAAEQVDSLLPARPSFTVVTSRIRLDSLVAHWGARQLPVSPLAPDDSITLVGEVLGAARIAPELDAVRTLIEACGHLPLALRLACAALLAQPFRTIASAAQALLDETGLDGVLPATAAGAGTASVRTAFSASIGRLSPAQRETFGLLALAPGPDAGLDAMVVMSGRPRAEIRGDLDRLVAEHLVEQDAADRYAMHDLLRAYGRQAGTSRDPVRALTGLAEHYAYFAGAAAHVLAPQFLRLQPAPEPRQFEDEEAALAWLDVERPNLVATVEAAAGYAIAGPSVRLADAMRGYLASRSYHDDWQRVSDAALTAAVAGGDRIGEAAMRANRATLEWNRANYPAARVGFEEAVRLHPCGWPEGEASARMNLAGVCRNLGDLDAAAEQYRRALDCFAATSSEPGPANITANLASLAIDRGDLPQALSLGKQALSYFTAMGSRLGRARQLQTLALAHLELGELDSAQEQFSEALALHTAAGARDGAADCLDKLARIARDSGDPTDALRQATESVELCRNIADRATEADALNTRSSARLDLGDPASALNDAEDARAQAQQAGYRAGEIEALTRIADAAAALGRTAMALATAQRSLTLARTAGYRLLEPGALLARARAHLAAGRHREAAADADQAIQASRASGQRLSERRAQQLNAQLARELQPHQ